MGWQNTNEKEIRLMQGENPAPKSFFAIYGQDKEGYYFYISPSSNFKVQLRWYELLLMEEDESRDIQVKVNHCRKVLELREKLIQAEKEFKRNV